MEQKAVKRGLRYDLQLNKRIEAATQEGGFSSPGAFMRKGIQPELASRESDFDAPEEQIAASPDRIAREIRNLRLGQQALFAFPLRRPHRSLPHEEAVFIVDRCC